MQKSALARARSLLPLLLLLQLLLYRLSTVVIVCLLTRPWRLINRFARRISRDDGARHNNIITLQVRRYSCRRGRLPINPIGLMLSPLVIKFNGIALIVPRCRVVQVERRNIFFTQY